MTPGISGRSHSLCHGWSSTVSAYPRRNPHAPVYASIVVTCMGAWKFGKQCDLSPRAQETVVTENMLASVHATVNILAASQAFPESKYSPDIAWRQFLCKIARSPESSIEPSQLHGFGKLNL